MRGSNGATTFIDESTLANQVTALGDTAISSAQSKFGGTSAYFTGTTGSGLRVVGGAAQNIAPAPESDFSIDAWIFPTAADGILLGNYLGVGSWLVSLNGGRISFTIAGAPSVSVTAATAITLNTWTHIAICRTGGVIRIFYDGVIVAGAANTSTITYTNPGGLGIGTLLRTTGVAYGATPYRGYISNLRITRAATYPASFTLTGQEFTDCLDPAAVISSNSSVPEFPSSSSSSSSSLSSSSSSSDSGESAASGEDSTDSSSSSSSSSLSSSSSSSNSSSSSSSSSSSTGLTTRPVATAAGVTTINLATLKTYATDWAIDVEISAEVKLVPGAVNNAGLVFNYVRQPITNTETYLLLKIDADADTLSLLRYNGTHFVTEYVMSLSEANFQFNYANWYRLSVTPQVAGSNNVAILCNFEDITNPQNVSFAVSTSNYGIPMGAPGIFSDRAYAYFNSVLIR